MTEFELLARRAAATGTLDADELRRLCTSATFAPVDDGLAQSIGMLGGSEIALARVIGDQIGERRKIEATIRAVIAGETRPANARSFLWTVARLHGRPPQNIADGLGVMANWSDVADALERRLSPPKSTPEGIRYPVDV
ncbi:MAG: hypothetical protein P4L80_12075 [Xanthobacteraceae bacterium]|nr:hypothetical protein [Xanthobacteraceae bacterium]